MIRQGPASRTALSPPSLWRLFNFCLTALTLLWLPMAVLQQVDALLRFVSPTELAVDASVLLVLLAVAALLLALLAAASGALLRLVRLPEPMTQTVPWLVVLVPVGLACLWQLALTVKLWLEQVLGMRLSTGNLPYRDVLVLAALVLLALAWQRAGVRRVIHTVTAPVLRASTMAWLAAAIAATTLAWQRPAVGASPRPLANLPAPAANAPDIILVTLDTLAFADAGVCGTASTHMPRLRQFAAGATCFTRHYTGSTLTHPSTLSLETSTLPWTHWVVHGGRPPADLADDALGMRLRQAGYRTHAITAAPGASPRQHDTYDGYDSAEMARSTSLNMSTVNAILEFPDSRALPGLLGGVLSISSFIDLMRLDHDSPYPSENVYLPALQLLGPRTSAQPQRPAFVWLHAWPPHAPYLPPPSTRYRLLPQGQFDRYKDFLSEVGSYDLARQATVDKVRLRYQETILGADESLGVFLDDLERQGLLDRALVVITSDHGESFERGVLRHGGPALHEAVIRVPLVIKLPGQSKGQVIDQPTSQIDIAPTLLEAAHAAPIAHAEGHSLLPMLHGDNSAPPRPVVAMALLRESRFQPLRTGLFTIIDGPLKLVYTLHTDRSELYDLAQDPAELHDLSASQPEVVERLRRVLRERIAQAEIARARRFGNAAASSQQEP
jgi:arylsulfatase A-like enzyme